jgi:hypothetical protein
MNKKMCIITSNVKKVDKTRIYVSADANNHRQLTVYSNSVDTLIPNAMVLPVPNPDSVELLDFSHYKNFFDDLKLSFHTPASEMRLARSFSNDRARLPIYSVGSYDVTIVPTLDDFYRIDFQRFRIDSGLFDFLQKHYSNENFGFLICDLKPGDHEYHPFAYTHHQHRSGRLFVPTMHYHPHSQGFDSESHVADWDHLIYSPSTTLFSPEYKFRSNQFVNWKKLPEEYRWGHDTELNCWKKEGKWQNHDLWIHHTVNPVSVADDCVIM